MQSLDFGSVASHRYFTIAASALSLIESTYTLIVDSADFSSLADIKHTFDTGENWLSLGSILHHLLMLPVNLAQLLVAALIDPTEGAMHKSHLTIFSSFTFLLTAISWVMFEISPITYALLIDQSGISGMDDMQVIKLIYLKFLSAVLNGGSASEMLIYSLSL